MGNSFSCLSVEKHDTREGKIEEKVEKKTKISIYGVAERGGA